MVPVFPLPKEIFLYLNAFPEWLHCHNVALRRFSPLGRLSFVYIPLRRITQSFLVLNCNSISGMKISQYFRPLQYPVVHARVAPQGVSDHQFHCQARLCEHFNDIDEIYSRLEKRLFISLNYWGHNYVGKLGNRNTQGSQGAPKRSFLAIFDPRQA